MYCVKETISDAGEVCVFNVLSMFEHHVSLFFE